MPYAAEEQESEQAVVEVDIKELGKEQPARWISVDPMADKYPGWSPYNYAVCNPVNIIDEHGDSVEVAYVWTAPMAYHTFIIHTDEGTGKQRNIAEGMPTSKVSGVGSGLGETAVSGSGGAVGSLVSGNEGWGNLETSITNTPEDVASGDRETVPVPADMTENEFVSEIKAAVSSYDNQVRYAPVPLGNRGNSNSFVGSVLRAAGSNFQPSRWSPGWNKNVLPSQRKK